MIDASKEDLAKSRHRKRARPLVDDPISETISYDDFAKIDLRVALIKKAEAVPEADKLLKLQLDIGGETRQVFAGIKSAYNPEDLEGKLTVMVANLARARCASACPKAWCWRQARAARISGSWSRRTVPSPACASSKQPGHQASGEACGLPLFSLFAPSSPSPTKRPGLWTRPLGACCTWVICLDWRFTSGPWPLHQARSKHDHLIWHPRQPGPARILVTGRAGRGMAVPVSRLRQGREPQRLVSDLNPSGKMPVLGATEFVLTESAAIMQYLAEVYGPNWLPARGTQASALHAQWVSFITCELEQPLWTIGKHRFALPGPSACRPSSPPPSGEFDKAAAIAESWSTRAGLPTG